MPTIFGKQEKGFIHSVISKSYITGWIYSIETVVGHSLNFVLRWFATFLTAAPVLIFAMFQLGKGEGAWSVHWLEPRPCLFWKYETFVTVTRNLFDGITCLYFSNVSMRQVGGVVSHWLEPRPCLLYGHELNWSIWAILQSWFYHCFIGKGEWSDVGQI